ncbi:hypothetical protein GQ53DRAFT_659915 [Thozetella sp. PMI_491]|nr:hypothetical protein GQ53DRAFT_659915 [Thozetella sp. PMI_491]
MNPGTPRPWKPRRWCTWPWHWRLHPSWFMYVFLLFGIACAVGHHIFYTTLDRKPAQDQVVMLRYGTLLAFASKAGLSAAVVTAYRQRVWATVRTRLLSIKALDSLFSATEDFGALWNWEFIRRAKTAIALAVFVWISPLLVILTSNTLVVEPMTAVETGMCPGARSLNFTFEETNDWRTQAKIGNLFEIPLSLWNTTKPDTDDGEAWFDYYTGPNPRLAQTATIGAFLEEVVPRKNASIDICGSGWNCTYDISFIAPGYKCTELASGVGAKATNLTQASGSIAPPFDLDIIVPKGPYTYYAFTSGGEYSTTQMKEVGIGGRPTTKPPYPKHFGAFRTEPVIWIGYALLADPNVQPPDDPNDPNWKAAFTSKLFACEHYETQYNVTFNYTESTQYTNVTARKFLNPIVNTTFLRGVEANDGTADNTTAVPEDNYVYPTDVGRYRRIGAYHSLGYMLRDFINGTVEVDEALANPIVNTDAIQTKLLDPASNYFPVPDLAPLIQSFYEELILSVFSNGQFVPVVWAAQPGEQSGERKSGGSGGNETAYMQPCTRSRTANMFSYHQRDLWIVYAIAITLALAGVLAGAWAIWENDGALRDVRFSSVTAATRGPALDKLDWEGRGSATGADVPRDIKGQRMGYGLLHCGGTLDGSFPSDRGGADGSTTYKPAEIKYGFGLEGDVQQMREGSIIFRNFKR